MGLIRKIENHLSRKFNQIKMNPVPEYKTKFKTGEINVNFDLEIQAENGHLLIRTEKLTEDTVDLITMQYIFANKLFSEMELDQKVMIIVASNRAERLVEKLILNIDFSNNFLFHNRGITFKVVDFDEFKRVSSSLRTIEELVTKFKK